MWERQKSILEIGDLFWYPEDVFIFNFFEMLTPSVIYINRA